MANNIIAARDYDEAVFALSGEVAHTWLYTARIRAVVGSNHYPTPGVPSADRDALILSVSANGSGVPEDHGLNQYSPGGDIIDYNYPIDEEITFTAKGNAILTLKLSNRAHFQYEGDVDGNDIEIPPLPIVKGIWAQLDFVSAVQVV